MNSENLIYQKRKRFGIITLNRPDKRNALSMALLREMVDLLKSIREDRKIRVVIIKSRGSVFSSGHDMSEMLGKHILFYERLFDTCSEVMEMIRHLPQPVIAQVQGIATAAGCQLVAACDLAVASEDARFATPGVRIGLFCSTPMVPLSRAVGRKKALEMLLTGDMISAREAERWGLINKVVPPQALEQEVESLATRIAESSPSVVQIGKRAFYSQTDMEESAAYGYAVEVITLNATTADAQEGISAFLEKREPIWQAR
jgi:enoyl-CoA hydratase/carnithine racemase